MAVLPRAPGYLGVNLEEAQATDAAGAAVAAVRVLQVVSGSPAARDGLQPYDLLLAIDDLDLARQPGLAGFTRHVRQCRPATPVKLRVRRGADVLTVTVTVGELPPEQWGDADARQVDRQERFAQWLRERLAQEPGPAPARP